MNRASKNKYNQNTVKGEEGWHKEAWAFLKVSESFMFHELGTLAHITLLVRNESSTLELHAILSLFCVFFLSLKSYSNIVSHDRDKVFYR